MIEFHAALLKIHYPTRCRHTLKKPTNKQQTPNVYGITISQSKNVQSSGRPQNVLNKDVVCMTAGFFPFTAFTAYQRVPIPMQCQCWARFNQAAQISGAEMPPSLHHLKPMLIHLFRPIPPAPPLNLLIADSFFFFPFPPPPPRTKHPVPNATRFVSTSH